MSHLDIIKLKQIRHIKLIHSKIASLIDSYEIKTGEVDTEKQQFTISFSRDYQIIVSSPEVACHYCTVRNKANLENVRQIKTSVAFTVYLGNLNKQIMNLINC
jgi:hypothetical protein